MSKFVQGAIVTLVLVAAMAASSAQAAVTIFLSDKGLGEGATLSNPVVSGAVGEAKTVYVWVRNNDPAQTLGAVSLNLATNNPEGLDGVSATVLNPNIATDLRLAGLGTIPTTSFRWNGVGSGDVNPAGSNVLLHDFKGVAGFANATGIDSSKKGGLGLPLDLGYDAQADAFLFAHLSIQIVGDLGPNGAQLFLQNSEGLTGKLGGSSQDIDILFGAGESTTMKGAVVGTNSLTPDGSVLIPEPASLALLALGGLALLRRR